MSQGIAITELLPDSERVLVVGTTAAAQLEGRNERSITRSDAADLESLGETRFDAVVLGDVLESVEDPSRLLRFVLGLLSEGGGVVASFPNFAHGTVRLALLAGRFPDVHGAPVRFFTRETIEDLFAETGYVITHWVRERVEFGDSARLGRDPIHELIASDPESTTYRFAVRAVPSEAAAQLAAAQAALRAAQSELTSLKRSAEDAESLKEELTALHRAHEERGRRLVAERLEFANELTELQRHIDALHRSRSFRYTAPLRNFLGRLRGRR